MTTTSQAPAQRTVVGPDGAPLSLVDLPGPDTRWTVTRKARVVAAIRGGLLSFEDARSRYGLTDDELLSWMRRLERFGLGGLRATRVQAYPS